MILMPQKPVKCINTMMSNLGAEKANVLIAETPFQG